MASTTCYCSSCRLSWVIMMLLALSKWHLTNPLFTCTGWWEWKFKYRSVCVGFLYMVTSRLPLSFHPNRVSRNGRIPSFSSSTVKWILGRSPLRWSKSREAGTTRIPSIWFSQLRNLCYIYIYVNYLEVSQSDKVRCWWLTRQCRKLVSIKER